MRIEIPLAEVKEFLSNSYRINVGLKNIEEGRIEVDYLVSFVLAIKEVKADEVTFKYKTTGFVRMLAKGADFLSSKRLEDSAIDWNSKDSEVTVFLAKVKAFSNLLANFSIVELHFINDSIVVELVSKPNIE
jgi:hypothetical protein